MFEDIVANFILSRELTVKDKAREENSDTYKK